MKWIKEWNLFEAVTAKDVREFLTDFGWLVSMNFSQITQQAVDEDAERELNDMMKQIRKPILNGMNYFDFIRDNINEIPKNPKMLSAVIGIVRDYLVYIRPRIEKFVKDGEKKEYYLRKIGELETEYRRIIA